MNARRFGLIALVFAGLTGAPVLAQDAGGAADGKKKKSVILFIGDGMGVSQTTIGRLAARELDQPYNLDRFEVVGLASTRSTDCRVTDSAAAATALACGVKTNNKVIAQDPGNAPVQTLMEAAHACSYVTGVVTSTRVTHATPACFVAHVEKRSQERDIAEQMSAKGYPEVLMGGGARNFKAESFKALEEGGYEVVRDPAGLEGAKGKKLAAVLASSHIPYRVDGGERVSLLDMTRKAVGVLESQGPFVIMVEGGRIDHACHQHDAVSALHEQLEFDAAVGWALDRAQKDPNLLVVVTADHATGAMAISELVDVRKLLDAKASADELAKNKTPEALAAAVKETCAVELTEGELARVFEKPKDRYWAATAIGHFVSQHMGVYFYDLDEQQHKMHNTHGHDGADVAVYAYGPGAAAFAGSYENTEIPKTIVAILGLEAGVEKGSALVDGGERAKKAKRISANVSEGSAATKPASFR